MKNRQSKVVTREYLNELYVGKIFNHLNFMLANGEKLIYDNILKSLVENQIYSQSSCAIYLPRTLALVTDYLNINQLQRRTAELKITVNKLSDLNNNEDNNTKNIEDTNSINKINNEKYDQLERQLLEVFDKKIKDAINELKEYLKVNHSEMHHKIPEKLKIENNLKILIININPSSKLADELHATYFGELTLEFNMPNDLADNFDNIKNYDQIIICEDNTSLIPSLTKQMVTAKTAQYKKKNYLLINTVQELNDHLMSLI